MKRETDEIIEANAERELIAGNPVAWAEAVRQDAEHRSMLDAPLPDVWYVEAARVAKALGQPAATALMQAEHTRRNLARIDARRAAYRVHYGRTPTERLASALWALVAYALGALGVWALLAQGVSPAMAQGCAYALGALVALASVRAACDGPE